MQILETVDAMMSPSLFPARYNPTNGRYARVTQTLIKKRGVSYVLLRLSMELLVVKVSRITYHNSTGLYIPTEDATLLKMEAADEVLKSSDKPACFHLTPSAFMQGLSLMKLMFTT